MHKDTSSTKMRKGNHIKGYRYGNKRKMLSKLKKKGRREERHQLNKSEDQD